MHKNIKIIKKIFKIIKKSTKKPITIKLRKSPETIKIAKEVEKYIDAITIHPRTISQGYSGKPDYKFALKLKNEIKKPIIYSGDVNEKNAKEILKDFDFVLIGRSAIGNPNIFSRLTNKKTTINFKNYLDLAKKYKIYFRQIKYQALNFTKGAKNAKKIRKNLAQVKNTEEIEKILIINTNK